MGFTKALGRFVAELSRDRLPDQAAATARTGFIDTIGTMIAGRNEACVRMVQEVLEPADGPSSLYLGRGRSPALEAAWLNGTAAHALDYDDVALGSHPSCVLVASILAEAEALDASGAAMITAYVAGYETWAELHRRDTGQRHLQGWHPTASFGAIGAAAACASLHRLDAAHAAEAIALGASQGAGLPAHFGAMTKPFLAGRSAHAGILAARLATAGFTARTDALDHPNGWLTAVLPSADPDPDSEARLGHDWAIVRHGLSIRRYPVCDCAHRAIDSALGVVATHAIQPEAVKAITVHISDYYATVLRNHRPETADAARFSIEFAMASAIIAGHVGLPQLTDAFVQRADVQALMQRVATVVTGAHDPALPGAASFDQARVEVVSGALLEGERVGRAAGQATRPLSDAQLWEKFVDCLEAGGSDIAPDTLFARLQSLDTISARKLTAVE
jgi:2-methylcitrate dehydratase PrpD